MLISIGEILVDIFKSEKGETALPGGAPFNLACNALNYTRDVYFVGAVGNDENGRMLLKVANEKGFVKNGVKVLMDRETTRAVVTLKDGERSFTFERDNGADYRLSLDDVDFSLIKSGDIVHVGSLMLSYKEGIQFFNSLVKKIKEIKGVKLSFDINYRDDIFPSSESAKEIFINALKQADILKFSDDELILLSGETNIATALKNLLKTQQIAVITLGKNGSMLYKEGKIYQQETVPVKPVDTTGAGDAFYSYFLSSLVNHPHLLDDEKMIHQYLFRSNIVGGLTTLKKGAIGVAPLEQEIDDYIVSHT